MRPYLEIPARDLSLAKAFFERVFGWTFVDYGPNYCAFSAVDIEGGFYQTAEHTATVASGSVLIVLRSKNLENTLAAIEDTGQARIYKPIFSFPGGRRFHFLDPNGNEFAVWSEQ